LKKPAQSKSYKYHRYDIELKQLYNMYEQGLSKIDFSNNNDGKTKEYYLSFFESV